MDTTQITAAETPPSGQGSVEKKAQPRCYALWQIDASGLACDYGTLRLLVQGPGDVLLLGGARFLVLRKSGRGEPDTLIGSGHERSVRDAMVEAERIAAASVQRGR